MMKEDNGRQGASIPNDEMDGGANQSHSTMQPLEIMTKPLVQSNEDSFLDEEGTTVSSSHHAASSIPTKSSTAELTVNIIISFVGAGLLGIPFAFQKAGWLLGSVALMGTSALNVYAMLRIPAVRARLVQQQAQQDDEDDDYPGDTNQNYNLPHSSTTSISEYSDLGFVLLGGHTGKVIVQIALAVSQTGFATAYIIFIAANVEQIFGLARSLTCVLCLPGLCLLVQAPDMTKLAKFSLFANLSNLVGLTAVLWVDVHTIWARSWNDHTTASDDASVIYDDAILGDDDLWIQIGNDDDGHSNRHLLARAHDLNSPVVVEAVKWGGLLYVMSITLYSMEGVVRGQ